MDLDKKKKRYNITHSLVIANILVFILTVVIILTTKIDIRNDYGFSLQGFLGGSFWTPVTSIFLHGSVSHLILNMISLFFFGRALENEVSKGKYLTLYFGGGIVSTLIASIFYSPDQISVGASGAIFALIAATMIIKPLDFVAFPYVIPVPIVLVGTVMIISNLVLFASPPDGSNISFGAHLSGAVIGLVFGFREKGMKKSLIILGIAVIVFLFISRYLGLIDFLNYTKYIQESLG